MKKITKTIITFSSLIPLVLGGVILGVYSSRTIDKTTTKTDNINKSSDNPITPNENGKNTPNTSKPKPSINNRSNDQGIINNDLLVSAFKTYVEKLGLTKLDRLSVLTNEYLNKKLESHYPELQVKILSGSDEATGTLILQFSGHHNGQKINGQSTITGFENYDGDYFSLQNIKVNFTNWFAKQLPIIKQPNQVINLTQINNNNLLNDLIASADVALWHNNNSHVVPLQNGLNSWTNLNATLKIKTTSKPSQKTYSLQLSDLTIEFKTFDGNQWHKSKTKKITANSAKPTKFPIPILSDLEDHILAQTNIKNSAGFKNYYPSYFRSKWEASKGITGADATGLRDFTNYSEIENQYNNYLNQTPKTHLSFKIDPVYDGLTADDYAGTLIFRMQLKEEGSSSGIGKAPKTKEFKLSGLKKVSDFISEQKAKINNFYITSNNPNLNFYKKILTILKNSKNINQVNNFFDDVNTSTTIEIDVHQLQSTLNSISPSGYFFKAEDHKNTWETVGEKISKWNSSLWLFNKSLKVNGYGNDGECNLNNKNGATEPQPALYICKNQSNSAFYIQSLKYGFKPTANNKIIFKLTKNEHGSNAINIAFDGQTIVGFNNIDHADEQFPTQFLLNNLQKDQLT